MGRLDWAGCSMICDNNCSTKKWGIVDIVGYEDIVIVMFRPDEAVLPRNIVSASATMGENYAGRRTFFLSAKLHKDS